MLACQKRQHNRDHEQRHRRAIRAREPVVARAARAATAPFVPAPRAFAAARLRLWLIGLAFANPGQELAERIVDVDLVRVFVRAVDRLNRAVGMIAAVLVPIAVVLCAAVALLRYGFGFGRVWMQELYVVLCGVSFMLMSARVHGEDGHVRVDIFWRRWSERQRDLVDLLGNLLLLVPWTLVLLWSSWGFVALSWSVLEPSAQAGGLPGLFLVKTVIPLAALMLFVQALSGALRAALRLAGRSDPLAPSG